MSDGRRNVPSLVDAVEPGVYVERLDPAADADRIAYLLARGDLSKSDIWVECMVGARRRNDECPFASGSNLVDKREIYGVLSNPDCPACERRLSLCISRPDHPRSYLGRARERLLGAVYTAVRRTLTSRRFR